MEEASIRYYALFNASPIAYCMIDETSTIMDFNNTFRDLIGLSAKMMLDRKFNILLKNQASFFLEVFAHVKQSASRDWHRFEIRQFSGGKSI